MHRRIRALALVAVVAAPSTASAQYIFNDLVSDFKNGGRDILAVWASPFKGSARDYLTTAAVLGLTGAAMFADESVSEWFRENDSSAVLKALKPFRVKEGLSIDNIGAAHWNTRFALVLYTGGLLARKPGLRDAGMGCIASVHSQAAPRSVIVHRFIYRERPDVRVITGDDTTFVPGDALDIRFKTEKDNWYEKSFYGGHVANLAACISFLNHRFEMGFVEPVLWASVAALGIARSADQRHWFSDQLLGVAVGYATGKYVAQRSKARARERAEDDPYAKPDSSASRLDALLGSVFIGQGREGTVIGWQWRR
jgi:hypothetical protein